MTLNALKKVGLISSCLLSLAAAQAPPDFSGNYAAGKGKAGSEGVTLQVVQTESAVEVARTEGGRTVTNRFPLAGSEGEWTSPTGVPGKCKARFRKDTLVLETSSTTTRADGKQSRLQTREEWRLSKDAKTLTVRIEILFPDMPAEIVAMAFPNNPRTETFERTAER